MTPMTTTAGTTTVNMLLMLLQLMAVWAILSIRQWTTTKLLAEVIRYILIILAAAALVVLSFGSQLMPILSVTMCTIVTMSASGLTRTTPALPYLITTLPITCSTV